jgi:transcriptional regulator with XRE-family HTH domain
VSTAEQALARRIKDLRRRHYGARGKERFAQRLGVPAEEYARYERGSVPPGEVLVRICDVTGEDLQWLLTGVAGRGTVVIAGTRGRHQDLLARLARLLDEQPQVAAPVEAFVDLLARSALPRDGMEPAWPGSYAEHLIPIFEPGELPAVISAEVGDTPGPFDLAPFRGDLRPTTRTTVEVVEPAMQYSADELRAAEVLTVRAAGDRPRQCLRAPEIARCFPGAFGVRLGDESMAPMFRADDAVLVAIGLDAKVGRPALCRVAGEAGPRCRIWLGDEADLVQLGRITDGECEQVPRDKVLWSLEVLYRVARAA